MDTQTINPYSENKDNKGKKAAGIAAAAVGAAALGTGVGIAAARHSGDEPVVNAEEEVVPTAETPVSNPHSPEAIHEAPSRHTMPPKPEARPHAPRQPQEHGNDEHPGTRDDNHGDENTGGQEHGGDNTGGEDTPTQPLDPPTDEEIAEYDDKNLDPDQEADEMLAEEQVDASGDAEVLEDMITDDYEEVRVIYTDEGEAQTAAVRIDENGNEVLLVDMDGDQVFDEMQGNGMHMDVSDLGLNVGDVELNNAGDEYLANNGENVDNIGDENYMDDMIS